jgi:hypothetical protein
VTRTLSALMGTSLGLEQGPALVAFLELAFGGGTVRLATAPMDLSWNGQTWSGIGGRLVIDPPRETPGDDRAQSLRLELSGVTQTVLATLLQQQYIGRSIRVWYAHVALTGNLLSNSGAETNANGVATAGAGTTVTRVTSPVLAGAGSFDVSVGNVSAAGIILQDATAPGGRPVVTVGTTYVGRALVRLDTAAGAAKTLRIRLHFIDSGGATVSLPADVNYTLAPGETVLAETTAAEAPAGAVTMTLRVDTFGAQGAFHFYVDDAQLTVGSRIPSYQPTDGAPVAGGTVLADPLLLFSGFMNGGFQLEESAEFDQLTATIGCRVTSRLAMLTNRRGIKTNLESHGRLFLGDRFFEHVPQIANADILWGAVAGWVNRYRGIDWRGTVPTNPRRP